MNRSQIDALIVSKFIAGPTMSHILAREGMAGVLNYIDRLMGNGQVLFLPDFGAMCDDTRLLDVTVTNGSKTITSASAQFTAGDVGKAIKLNWCDDGNDLVSTIATYINANAVTIADFPNMPTDNDGVMPVLNNVTCYYGTDDTAAIQAAIDAADAMGSAEIIVPGYCVLAGEIVGSVGGANFRGLVNVPPTNYFRQNPGPGHIRFRGLVPQYTLSTDRTTVSYPFLTGCGFHAYTSSTTPGDAIIATAGNDSTGGVLSHVFCTFKDLNFLVPTNGGLGYIIPGMGVGLSAVNGSKFGTVRFEGCNASIDDALLKSGIPTVRHYGYSTTDVNSQHMSAIENSNAVGFYDGAQIGEHVWVNQFSAFAALHPYAHKEARFGSAAGVITQHWCKYGIGYVGTGTSVGMHVQMLNIECKNDSINGTPAWWRTVASPTKGGLLYDPANQIRGGSARYVNGSGIVISTYTKADVDEPGLVHPMTLTPN